LDARLAAQRFDAQSGIVGERGPAARQRRGASLDDRVGGKGRAGLRRLGKTKGCCRQGDDAERAQKVLDLAQLAGIVGRDHDFISGNKAPAVARSPDARLCEFDAVAGGIADIDRAAALRPFEISVDREIEAFELAAPGIELGGIGGEAEMAGAGCTMRRDRQGGVAAAQARDGGVENQDGAGTAAEEHMPAGFPGDPRKAEKIAIEALGGVEVLGVEHAFEHLRRYKGHATARSCRATSSPMPLRASRKSSKKRSSEKATPSAVAWISTIPASPVRTKFASVSALLSSS
jgi:hypothetical protein